MRERSHDVLSKAVALLAQRERTSAELARALHARDFGAGEVSAALARLGELGYLDDGRVAAHRAARWLAGGRARADVQRRLLAQGIEASTATEAIEREAAAMGHSDEASLRRLLAARRLTGPKAARWLAARGFDEGLIRSVLGLDGE